MEPHHIWLCQAVQLLELLEDNRDKTFKNFNLKWICVPLRVISDFMVYMPNYFTIIKYDSMSFPGYIMVIVLWCINYFNVTFTRPNMRENW